MMIDLSESVMAFVGRGWMFSATPSSAVSGPFIVIDRAVFTPGIQGTESEVYTPGVFDIATFTPGAVDQEFWT